jgi:hypothetical protein
MAVPKTWSASELLTNTDLNASLASTAWTAVTFTNSWVNFGSTQQTVQYRKVGDMVQIRGMMKSGTIAAGAFTLPSGFRPPADQNFSTVSNALFGYMTVAAATGVFTPAAGSNVYFEVDCQFSVTT